MADSYYSSGGSILSWLDGTPDTLDSTTMGKKKHARDESSTPRSAPHKKIRQLVGEDDVDLIDNGNRPFVVMLWGRGQSS